MLISHHLSSVIICIQTPDTTGKSSTEVKAARRTSREAAQPQYSKIITAAVTQQQPNTKPPPAARIEQKPQVAKNPNLPPTKPSPTTYPPTFSSSSSIKKKDSYNLATKGVVITSKGVSKQPSIKGNKITSIDELQPAAATHGQPATKPSTASPASPTTKNESANIRTVKLAPPSRVMQEKKDEPAPADQTSNQQPPEPVVVMVCVCCLLHAILIRS